MQLTDNKEAGGEAVPQSDRDAQIQRLLNSKTLRGSESLRALLTFLAAWAREHGNTAPKEHLIATSVLGRPDTFDPQADPAVRVQIGRLRTKLADYYAREGSADPVLVSIPRGSHVLEFARRAEPSAAGEAPVERRQVRLGYAIATAVACAVVVGFAVWLVAKPAAPDRALRTLWAPFLAEGQSPVAVFSNAAFIGSPRDGLRYFRPGEDPADQMLDTYTGVGEVAAVRDLSLLFAAFRHPLRVKRGRLLMWDEDRYSNLIFVGSQAENSDARVISESLTFRFKSRDLEPHVGRPGVLNQRPAGDEPPLFVVRQGRPIIEDFAIVASLPGMSPGRHAMLLAGCTTLGTGAAAEFASSSAGAAELVRRAGPGSFFEAVLHVRVDKGVPTQTSIVAFHRRDDLRP